jgi:DNA-binding FadR family transcriptional regulator
VSEQVHRRILDGILDGTYPIGTRLPPERVLAAALGASRVAVRESLGRLQAARIIDTRHGSGATVQPRRHWTAPVLGPLLARGLRTADGGSLAVLVRDAMDLRRALLLELLGRAARPLAGTRLEEPRRWVDRAWACREDLPAFFVADREVLPLTLEAAGMLASLWTLNALADSYLGVMAVVGQRLVVPPGYRDDHEAVLQALEGGDAARARERFEGYLGALDAAILRCVPAAWRG